MNTSQLECIIECDASLNGSVIDVFAADKLPTELTSTPFGFISKTDIHTKPGQHWCAFFSCFARHLDFFYSYGRTPSVNSHYFRRWLEINANSVQINHVQSNSSTLCGLYCILFLHQRLVGYTYQDFLNSFDAYALNSNDNFVADMMLKAYSQCVGNGQDHNQICCF